MSNPASFATAATTEGNNTFTGDQTVTGALAVTGNTTLTGDLTVTGRLTATGGADFAEVRAATTANITLSGAQTIDGVSVVAGNRVLVKNQSTASQNGLYLAAASAWSRAVDLPVGASAAGLLVIVQEGSVNADTTFLCTSDVGSDVVGTNNLVFASGAVVDSLLLHKAGAESITGVKTFTADPVLAAEAAHVLIVGASTTTDTAGGALAIRAGAGAATNANGGALTLDAGAKAGSGTDGAVSLGATNAEAVTIGRTGKTTTIPGALAVTQATTLTGNVGVGAAPVASAALAVTSVTQGFLPPVMTEVERDAIATPAEGLVIYNTTSHKLNVRVAAAWEAITSA